MSFITLTQALMDGRQMLRELEEYNKQARLPMNGHNWEAYKEYKGFTDEIMSRYFVLLEG